MWARMCVAIIGGLVTVRVTGSAMNWAEGAMSYVWGGVAFSLLALATLYLAFFHVKIGDMLIDTESEMRKVVWPSRDEVKGSTIVVVATTILLGTTIYFMDYILARLLVLVNLY